jgi:LysR family glycine cleavage system transcriptional activator
MLGNGVALARGLLAADDLRQGRVVAPIAFTAPAPMQYYVVCHPDRHGERTISVLRDWLLATARATVADLPALIRRGVSG